jgi:hypothetical protein
MHKYLILILFLLPAISSAAPAKKIEACVANGGTWAGRSCHYPSPAEICQSDGGIWDDGTCVNIGEAKACVADGGVWTGTSCEYPDIADECTPATQLIDCRGGTTSATGPGVCVLGKNGHYRCDYLYQQSCTNDFDCADLLGVDSSVYVCCQRGDSYSNCANALLCR